MTPSVTRPTATESNTSADTSMSLKRYTTLVGWGLLVTTLGQMSGTGCIGYYPLRFLLKDQLHISPSGMATFFFWAVIPWSFKPIAGLLTDGFPLLGSRRRYYLLLAGLGGGTLWLMMNIVPQTYRNLSITAFLLNCVMVLASVVTGGLLVEGGQTHGATGRLSSLRLIVINASCIIGGPLGGFLAAHWFGWTTITGAILFFSLVPATILLLREPRIDHWRETGVHPLRSTLEQIHRIFRNKDIWICAGLLFLVQISPGLGTPLLYYQTDQLKFDPEFIGMLAMASGITGLLGSFIYPFLCNRFRLRTLLFMAILCTIASGMTYLGYVSRNSALIIESAAGLGITLAQLPLFDLAARGATRGSEALAYSLMIAFWNLSLSFSDVIGATLFEGVRFTLPLVNHVLQLPPLTFKDLVWVNAGTTALVLLVIPFLPGRLVDKKESEFAMRK